MRLRRKRPAIRASFDRPRATWRKHSCLPRRHSCRCLVEHSVGSMDAATISLGKSSRPAKISIYSSADNRVCRVENRLEALLLPVQTRCLVAALLLSIPTTENLRPLRRCAAGHGSAALWGRQSCLAVLPGNLACSRLSGGRTGWKAGPQPGLAAPHRCGVFTSAEATSPRTLQRFGCAMLLCGAANPGPP